MDYIEQFIASITFNVTKILSFRFQTIWKTILYILLLVLISNLISTANSLLNLTRISDELIFLPENYIITENGATSIGEESITIEIPILDILLIFGGSDADIEDELFLQNIIFMGENAWASVEALQPVVKMSYEYFPLLAGGAGVITKEDIILMAQEADVSLTTIELIYRYTRAFLDIVTHFILITLFAVVALSFKKIYSVSFKESFTISSYGITLPIVARTFFNIIDLSIPLLFTFYWIIVGIFVISTISSINAKNKNSIS